MRRSVCVSTRWQLALALAAATLIPGGSTAGQEQQPIFRVTSELVAVPVFVESGNTPVTDLTVDDFELRDNGVVQAIEAVDDASSPVDLVVVVDVSGSVAGPVPARHRAHPLVARAGGSGSDSGVRLIGDGTGPVVVSRRSAAGSSLARTRAYDPE